MSKIERIAIWVVLSLLVIAVAIGGVMIVGELRAIEATLASQTGGVNEGGTAPDGETTWWGGGEANPPPTVGGPTGPRVGIAGVRVTTGTVMMTVTVRSSAGIGDDLLYEAPVLVTDEGDSYPITSESLEEARLAYLDLVTSGQFSARLTFAGTPAEGARLILVFNPGQSSHDDISPRFEVRVPVIPSPSPSPEPAPTEGEVEE